MKLSSIVSERELARFEADAPMLGAQTAGTTVSGVSPTGSQTLKPGQQVQQDPNAQAKMLAQQAVDKQNQRKAIQDQIKQKQQEIAAAQKELQGLQKQLATY